MALSPAHILDAVGLDQSAVDRGLLIGLAGVGQVREEVGPVGDKLGIEPGVKLIQDVLPGGQALRLRPGPEGCIPGLAGLAPFRVSLLPPPPLPPPLLPPPPPPPAPA